MKTESDRDRDRETKSAGGGATCAEASINVEKPFSGGEEVVDLLPTQVLQG